MCICKLLKPVLTLAPAQEASLSLAGRSEAALGAAAGVHQLASWGGSHAAVLGRDGTLTVTNVDSWAAAACADGIPASSLLASSLPGELCMLNPRATLSELIISTVAFSRCTGIFQSPYDVCKLLPMDEQGLGRAPLSVCGSSAQPQTPAQGKPAGSWRCWRRAARSSSWQSSLPSRTGRPHLRWRSSRVCRQMQSTGVPVPPNASKQP